MILDSSVERTRARVGYWQHVGVLSLLAVVDWPRRHVYPDAPPVAHSGAVN